MSQNLPSSRISRHVWQSKYRYVDGETVHDQDIRDTWARVARAVASVEPADQASWAARFEGLLDDFKFLPGGRILAGAGTAREVTLFNCFVMGAIEDSLESIFENLKEAALTMQQGGGIGYDFSTLRPRGAVAREVGAVASGPVSFMAIWDSMCATILSTGARRGAMMATLRCDHPDIEEFVAAKRDPSRLRHFNLSVLVSDDFMSAVEAGEDWPLVFPEESLTGTGAGEFVQRRWSGTPKPVACRVVKRVAARALWDAIMRATFDYAEPGVLFIDRINRDNTLWYREEISATNPCGEIPLPPYGACDLGSINLTRFIKTPFTPEAHIDRAELRESVSLAVRFLDNVIDLSNFPLAAQEAQARGTRRIGLGITGLADSLVMLGLRYGEARSLDWARGVMEQIRDSAYRASVTLAEEKGGFPFFDRAKHLESAFVSRLPEDIQAAIADKGLRNSHLLAIAPTGTISLLANNVSSGIEPIFAGDIARKILDAEGRTHEHQLTDAALTFWRARIGDDAAFPPAWVEAPDLPPEDHLAMQAALQPFVDNAISKTVNVPEAISFERFKDLYRSAYHLGLKGCTTFKPNPISGLVLQSARQTPPTAHCCTPEREAD